MLRHLPKGSIFQSYRIGKLVKERPYGDPLHRCSLTLTAVPLCPAGEALVTSAKQTLSKPIADPALRALLLAAMRQRAHSRPAKVRLGRSATSLRMTQDGCSPDAFSWRAITDFPYAEILASTPIKYTIPNVVSLSQEVVGSNPSPTKKGAYSSLLVGHAQLGRQVRAGKPVLGRAYGHRAPHL